MNPFRSMRPDLTVRGLAVLIVVLSVFMVLGPLSTVEVKGAGCATGLSPRLHVTLLVPTSNPARRAWAAIIQNSLQCLGMDVSRVELPFSPNIYARALSPPTSIVGKTFDQGGFDILFRSEEHTSELQSQSNLVCRLLLEKKKKREHTQQ